MHVAPWDRGRDLICPDALVCRTPSRRADGRYHLLVLPPPGDPSVRLLRPRPPFRFDLALAYLRRSALEIVEVVEEDVYRRGLVLDGRASLLEVREAPGSIPLAPVLEVRLPGETDPARLDLAATLVARCFRIDDNLAELDVCAGALDGFRDLVAALRGLRALVLPSAFETLVWAIVGQQINVDFAYRLKQRLVETYGERIERAGRTYVLFPRPERLASLSPDELRPLQFSRQKARYITEAACLVADGRLDLHGLRNLSPDEAHERLVALTGVGRWTAEYVRMRGLGERDVLPAADVGLRVAAARVHGLAAAPTETELRALAEPLAGWRCYYAFYLWFSLRWEGERVRG